MLLFLPLQIINETAFNSSWNSLQEWVASLGNYAIAFVTCLRLFNQIFFGSPTTKVPVKLCERSSIRTIFVSRLVLTFIVSLHSELGNLEIMFEKLNSVLKIFFFVGLVSTYYLS